MFSQKTCNSPIAGITESSLLEISGPKAHTITASLLSDPTHLQLPARSASLYFPPLLPGHLLPIPNLHVFIRIPSAKGYGIEELWEPWQPWECRCGLDAAHPSLSPSSPSLAPPSGRAYSSSPKRRERICPSNSHRNIHGQTSAPPSRVTDPCLHVSLWEEDGC